MIRLFAVTTVLLVMVSCGRQQEQRTLTLMSYNVGAFSKYMDNSMEGIAGVIKEHEASFVGLNELDSCNRRHSNYQVKDLAEELGEGWNYHYASAFPYSGGSYGNGIVCKQQILNRYRVVLPKGDGSEQRSMAVVETEDCVFAALHLDHRSKEAALQQMQVANEWMTKVYGKAKKPVFLCGDFNVTPDSEVIALAKTTWTPLSRTSFTYSTKNPSKCIDYIFALSSAVSVQVKGYEVITQGTEELSDHYPVLVRVKF